MSDDPDRGLRALLDQPVFVRYWSAVIGSRLGMQILAVAVGWYVYDLTDSALALGLVGLAQFAPMAMVALPAGVVADRFNRRRILPIVLAIECALIALMLALLLVGSLGAEALYVLLALHAAARGFETPLGSAIIPTLVPPSLLKTALAFNSTSNQAIIISGPAIGGLLYLLGPSVVFAVVTALFALACVMAVRLAAFPMAAAVPAPGGGGMAIFAGLAFIRQRPEILGAISLDLMAVLLGGATALMPIFARDILEVGPLGLGLMRAAPAVGAIAMGTWLTLRPIQHRMGHIMFAAVAVFGLATIGFGLSRSLPFSLFCLAVLGAADQVSVVIRITLVAIMTPDSLRGRVSAVNSLFIGTSNQLGEFESGVTAAWLGVVPATIAGGLGTLAVVAAWLLLFPALRRIDTIVAPRDK
ncbi:MAG: MFS transporter [Alphaproteobacteria bacterium]|nr:MFS transporter [Alphaproteobacteria bacterium]